MIVGMINVGMMMSCSQAGGFGGGVQPTTASGPPSAWFWTWKTYSGPPPP